MKAANRLGAHGRVHAAGLHGIALICLVFCGGPACGGTSRAGYGSPTAEDCRSLGRIDDTMRRAAMIAVHAHSYWSDGRFPSGITPIPLTRAATILFCDRNRAAASRRHRAVAKLATYGLDVHGPADLPDILRALGADLDDLRRLTREARARYGGPRRFGLRDAEVFVSNRLRLRSVAPQAACPETEIGGDGIYGPGADFRIFARARVKKSVEEVAEILDPQSWDECSPLFEPDSIFMLKQNADLDCETPTKDNAGKPLGSDYDRILLEHFRATTEGIAVEFRNYLRVITWTDKKYPPGTEGRRYNAYYAWQAQCTGVVGNDSDVRLKRDDGHVWAQSDPVDDAWSEVHFEKILQFEDPAMTGSAQVLLAGLELDEQVRDMLCCVVP